MRNKTQESSITSVSSHSQEQERRREHTEVSRSNTTPAQVKIIYPLRVQRAAICGPLGYGGTTFPRIPLPHASRRVSAEGKICLRFRRRESVKSQSRYSLKVMLPVVGIQRRGACQCIQACLVPCLMSHSPALVTSCDSSPSSSECRGNSPAETFSSFHHPSPTPSAGQAHVPGFPCQRPPFHQRPNSGELASKSSFQDLFLP